MIRYCKSFRYGGAMLSNIIASDLTHVSVHVKDGSQQSTTLTRALKWSNTFVPTHAPSGPVLSDPLQCPMS
jgi:hypothetical protein